MEFYFKLQFRRLLRLLKDIGIHPFLMGILVMIVFGIFVFLLYLKTDYASYTLGYIALFCISLLSSANRNKFLLLNFNNKDYYKIRIIENTVLSLPFTIIFLWKEPFLFSIAFLLLSILLIFIDKIPKMSFIVPTPFKKIAYESIIGFRKYFLWIVGAHLLGLKAIEVGNFKLALFTIGLLNWINMSAYFMTERLEFVWIHNRSINQFLAHKISRGIICSIILSLPMTILVIYFFPTNWWIICILILTCNIYLSAIIMGKYSAFPHPINLPQLILFTISLFCPPLILFVIYLFYKQSKKRLITIL